MRSFLKTTFLASIALTPAFASAGTFVDKEGNSVTEVKFDYDEIQYFCGAQLVQKAQLPVDAKLYFKTADQTLGSSYWIEMLSDNSAFQGKEQKVYVRFVAADGLSKALKVVSDDSTSDKHLSLYAPWFFGPEMNSVKYRVMGPSEKGDVMVESGVLVLSSSWAEEPRSIQRLEAIGCQR
jgi:hypothetical protein